MPPTIFIHEHELPGCKIVFIGNQPRLNPYYCPEVFPTHQRMIKNGADENRICQVRAPSTDIDPGYQTVCEADYKRTVRTEGVILRDERSGGFLQTADCPTIVISDPSAGTVGFAHAGKFAMRPPLGCCGCTSTIATTLLKRMLERGSDPKHLHVYIVGAICPGHFPHDSPEGQAFVSVFKERFGDSVFDGDSRWGRLDLVKLARLQLQGGGIPAEQIAQAPFCTFEQPGAASHRQTRLHGVERRHANTIMVLKT